METCDLLVCGSDADRDCDILKQEQEYVFQVHQREGVRRSPRSSNGPDDRGPIYFHCQTKKEITMRNDDINHPKHYAGYPASIECIDITRHLNFQLGNAVKYIWRAGKKGGLEKEIEDLKKAEWYLWDQCDAPGPGGNEGIARLIFSLIPRRAFDSPLRHSLIEDVLYDRLDEARESLEAWIAKAERRPKMRIIDLSVRSAGNTEAEAEAEEGSISREGVGGESGRG